MQFSLISKDSMPVDIPILVPTLELLNGQPVIDGHTLDLCVVATPGPDAA